MQRATGGPNHHTRMQVGQVPECIVELEDEEVGFRGSAEVSAALAAVLYTERPQQRLRAEQQWEVAAEFDGRYSSPEWVAREKHWPPRLVAALEGFLQLR